MLLDAFGPATGRDRGTSRGRFARRIAVIFFVLLIVVTAGVGAGYLALLNHAVTTNVVHQALLPPDTETAPRRDAAAGSAQNILFIGSDALPGQGQGRGRSDVIVLMHINRSTSKVYLVHFPRDLYVDIPGHSKNKINAAYAFGGAPLLVRTLQKLVAVPIDHVAMVGFEGFKTMTDAVGGVNVYAEEPSTGFHRGYNMLNGEQALAFVRERHQLSRGDISRGRRQEAFIKALMLKALSKRVLGNPLTFAHLVQAGTKNLTVDNGFSVSEMRSQALGMRAIHGGDIVFITAPFSGFGMSPAGASIDNVDTQRMAQLSVAVRRDAMETYPVQDGTIP
jgi:LCP family protein required for cell wall assembly